MTAKIIDGRAVADKIVVKLKKQIDKLKEKPCIALVLVGDDPASTVYVNTKEKKTKEIGSLCKRFNLAADVEQGELLNLIDELNNDTSVHGILVQLPLPKHIDERLIIDGILPFKDVDGFAPVNIGNLVLGKPQFVPATPKGIMHLIESTGVKVAGKHAVVVGRSNTVGKPIGQLLLQKNATVTYCHSKTKHIEKFTQDADILVVAVGRAGFVTGEMIKPGAVVIDVGINRNNDGKLVGDVDFESAKEVAGHITPVPGGVGPMTIAMLLENTLQAMEFEQSLR